MGQRSTRKPAPTTGQLAPHDLAAESALLAAALISPDAVQVAVAVPPEDFYKPAHAHIATALGRLYERGEPVDAVIVADELTKMGLLETVGGHPALVDLMSSCPATSNAAAHARIVRDKATKRRLAALAGEITDMAHNGRDAAEIVTDAQRLLDQLADTDDDAGDGDGGSGGKVSVSTGLVQIAHELYRFGVSTDGDTYATPRTGPPVVAMLRGGKQCLRAQLAREYYLRTGRAATQQGLADALLVIEGTAQQTTEQPLHLRVARHDTGLWLDLGDPTGAAVQITPGGWSVQDEAPVMFRRTSLTAPLPTPTPGGDLGELWEWLNVQPEDRALLAAWLCAALQPEIPHPALALVGEQGTGKTTAMKLIVSVIDASPVPARKPPKDADSWVTAAAGSWVVGLDNLSDIAPWLSDSLCRAVTGDGDVRRMLYENKDLVVFSFRRCLVFNGIDLGGLRGDLADRLVPIQLQRIDDTARIDETRLWPAWEAAHPKVLGGLLDLAAAVEGALPTIELEARPRMADFARTLAAVDHVLGTDGLARYLTKQGALATEGLTADDFIAAIEHHLDGGTFHGTSAQLLQAVTPTDPDWRRPRHWPGNARAVTTRLHRQAPVMRKAGWDIDDDGGANHHGTVRWTITPPTREPGNPDPPNPRNPQPQLTAPKPDPPGAGNAGHADQDPPTPQPETCGPDPRNPRTAGNTQPHTPPLTSTNGEAGHAGHESGHLASDVWDLQHPCTRCSATATDISGLCAGCLEAGPNA